MAQLSDELSERFLALGRRSAAHGMQDAGDGLLEELSDELEQWFWHWFWADVEQNVEGLSEAQRLQRIEEQRKQLRGLRVPELLEEQRRVVTALQRENSELVQRAEQQRLEQQQKQRMVATDGQSGDLQAQLNDALKRLEIANAEVRALTTGAGGTQGRKDGPGRQGALEGKVSIDTLCCPLLTGHCALWSRWRSWRAAVLN